MDFVPPKNFLYRGPLEYFYNILDRKGIPYVMVIFDPDVYGKYNNYFVFTKVERVDTNKKDLFYKMTKTAKSIVYSVEHSIEYERKTTYYISSYPYYWIEIAILVNPGNSITYDE